MDQFQERLARLAELSDEELAALESEVVAAFDAADSDADLESMEAYADALDQIRDEKSSRTVEVSAEETVSVAASAETGDEPDSDEESEEPAVETEPDIEVEAPEGGDETESDDDATTNEAEITAEGDEPDGTPEEVEGDEAPESDSDEGEAVIATSETEAPEAENESEEQVATEITAEDVPEENVPVMASAVPLTIRAGGDIPGITAGAPLDSMDDVIEALTKKVNGMRNVSGDGEHIIVASFSKDAEVPDERMLRAGDMEGNSRKIRSLLSDKEALQPDALMAAAWCAPRAPIYDVPTIGTTARPVGSALPTFNADRGGITWMEPPSFPDLAGAVGLWRYSNDAWGSHLLPTGGDAAGELKPCLTVECGTEASADVDAITLCLCFNNMTARAFPEWIRGNTDLTMVAQARFAEQVLLSKMFSVVASGDCGPATSVGVARDFLFTVRTAAAAKRWTYRMDPDAPLQLLAPAWLGDAIAIDLGLQAPGDDTYSTSRSEVNGYLREANIDPIWYQDDVPGGAPFTGCVFPAVAQWLLYPTGSFLRLDTGDLNLGVVRTKEDVQKNSYCEFSETFETVAYMGSANGAWVTHGATEVNLFGATGAPIDLTE